MTQEEQDRLASVGASLWLAMVDGLRRAAINQGLSEDFAARVTAQLVAGSVALLEASGQSPAELMAQVTSKGGTTAAGLAVMNEGDALETIIDDALRAAGFHRPGPGKAVAQTGPTNA